MDRNSKQLIKRNRKPKARGRFPEQLNNYMPNPRAVITPNEVDVQLVYVFAGTLTNGAGTGVSRRWTPNAAYDVDPTLGSTNTPGFAELAAMYSYNRVVRYDYEIQVVNAANFPILCTVVNSNTDLSTSSGLSVLGGNHYAQQSLLSVATGGNPKHTFRGSLKVSDVLGGRDAETGDNYRGTSTATPVDLVYVALGVDGTGNVLTTGAYFLIRVRMYTRFYDRKTLSA